MEGSLFFVCFVGVVGLLGDKSQFSGIISVNCAVEARIVADVTLAGINVDLQDDAVLVAVNKYLLDLLDVPGLLALLPELFARPAVVGGRACCDSLLQRLLVHTGDHQDLAGLGILGNCGNQTIGVKFRLERICLFNTLVVGCQFQPPCPEWSRGALMPLNFNCQRLI